MKKKFKSILGISALTILGTLSLASCDNTTVNTMPEAPTFIEPTGPQRPDDNLTPPNTEFDGETSQNEIPDKTEDVSSIENVISALTSKENYSSELSENYVTDCYNITTSGEYYFTGSLIDPITIAKDCGNVHIILNNINFDFIDSSLISSKKGSNVIITVLGNNIAYNAGTTAKHIIDVKGNLTINGNGTLNINSTKSGISCGGLFSGFDATLNIIAVKHGITSDSVYLDGSTINASSIGKDIIHAESDYDEVETTPEFDYSKGFVYIKTATITGTNILGDGIQADSFVYIEDGIYNITTTATWNDNYIATSNNEKGMYNVTTHTKVSSDSVRAGSTYAALEESCKGIKVGEIDYFLATDTEQTNELAVESDKYAIVIKGGTFTFNTVDDGIHSNSGSIFISGGNITINTSDDGITADDHLEISGTANINITNSWEGLEAETINITGGNVTVFAEDDGINASNSNLEDNIEKQTCQINISGGKVDVTVNPNGDRDGIDSNGGILISGGTIITRGPNSENASALDAETGVSITGGTVIVVGYSFNSSFTQNNNGQSTPPNGNFGQGSQMGGMMSSKVSTNLTTTQDSSNGLSKGTHTVTIGDTVITYENAYTYSGGVTVYSSTTATIK